jgi:DNA (cytosine-5)-methyltransferase 1
MKLRAADLFCGAGGTTTGAEQSGRVKVELAVNHWLTAVQTHRANHPHVRHVCAPIDLVDPRDFVGQGLNVVLASPECIFHSNARGGKPVDDQRRATAWCVPRWAEVLRPKWLIIENVREFEDWGPLNRYHRPLASKKGEIFTAWVNALRALNYHVEWQLMNAANFGGATKRIRLFVVARLGHSSKPIPWPAITHAKEQWTPAASIIDWALPCPSIFGRKRPLADKTLRRIEIGLRKFCGPAAEPFIVKMRGTNTAVSAGDPLPTVTGGGNNAALAMPFTMMLSHPGDRVSPVTAPLPTITTAKGGEQAIVQPFILQTGHTGTTGRASYVHDPSEPLRTVTGRGEHAIVQPFISTFHNGPDGERRNGSLFDPLPTVDTQNRHGLVAPFMVDVNHGGEDGRGQSVEKPIGALSTKNGKSLVLPFITQYFGTGHADGIDEPLSTVTCKHRHGLAMAQLVQTMQELSIVDVGFRMLEPHELAAAQGFPKGYEIYGTKAEQVKQIGNSVHTAVARALCQAIGEAA